MDFFGGWSGRAGGFLVRGARIGFCTCDYHSTHLEYTNSFGVLKSGAGWDLCDKS